MKVSLTEFLFLPGCVFIATYLSLQNLLKKTFFCLFLAKANLCLFVYLPFFLETFIKQPKCLKVDVSVEIA